MMGAATATAFRLRTLAGVLRGETPAHPLTDTQWLGLVEAACEHRVLRAFVASAKGLHLPMPEAAADLAQGYERESVGFSLLQNAALSEILQRAADAGLRVNPLKGPALLQRLYGDAHRRHSSDLDLLAPASECAALGVVLGSLGFRHQFTGEFAKYDWVRGPLKIELHTCFDDPRLLRFPMGPVWDRAQAGSFMGQRCWYLHPSDELIFLSLHAARHGFQQLSWPLELARAFELLVPGLASEDGCWQRLPGQDAAALPGILLLGHRLTQRVTAQPLPALRVGTAARVCHQVELLAEEFWEAAVRGEAQHWNRLQTYRFLPRLEPSLRGRAEGVVRQLWISSTQHTSPETRIAGRWRIRNGLGRWIVRQAYLVGRLWRRS